MAAKPMSMNADRHWLSQSRVSAYCRILIGLYLLSFVFWLVFSKDGITPGGYAIGSDFIAFWSASYTGLHSNPADAYDMMRLFEAEKLAVPAISTYYPWFYPPTYYLAILPVALLPYLISYGAFILVTFAAYVGALLQAANYHKNSFLIIAFPGVFVNVAYGQNAFLTAALAGAAVINLEKRPAVAGVLIGLLCIKPHLATLFPLVLVVSGRWRSLLWACLTVAVTVAMSLLVLGSDVFTAFSHSPQAARISLEIGAIPWTKIPTVFTSMRMLGFGVSASYIAHFTIATAAAIAVVIVWRKRASFYMRASALFVGTFIISPYVYDYDLAWMAFPITWIVLEAMKSGWRRWEREALLGIWLSPILIPLLSQFLSLQIGPFIIVPFFIMVLRRALLPSPSSMKVAIP